MQERWLGGLSSSCIGLGCMGMTGFYGPGDDGESIATIHAALDAGVTLFDTADRYGLGRNEELLGRALGKREASVATKFGIVQGPKGERALDGSPAHVRRACEASLTRLGRASIDLFYLHRVDREVPIEETVGAMGRLVEEGKVRFLGLCEVGDATLRRAHATWPISAVQSEYSLWCRDPESEVLAACRELGVGFVAYWALGIGMLTGRYASMTELDPGDVRPQFPRFQAQNLAQNLELVRVLQGIAERLGVTSAQLALAWVLAKSPSVVALAGTKRRAHLAENLGAAELSLEPAVVREIELAFPYGAGAGDRYPPDGMRWLRG